MTGPAATTDARLRLKSLIANGEARLLPLTFPQRELWENSPVAPGDVANHICATIEIRGVFSFSHCGAALRTVVDRHEVLRTSFLSGDGKAAQIVLKKTEVTLPCREVGPNENPEDVIQAAFSEPFDLVRGPVYRVEMIRLAADHHILALVFHHAIADGWTLGVFVGDFTAAYLMAFMQSGGSTAHFRGAVSGVPPLGLSYSAWASSEKARWQPADIEREAGYWRNRLAGSKLLFQCPRTESPVEPLQKRVTTISEPLLATARLLAKQEGVTLFSVLLTTFQIALYLWKGTQDVVLGVPHANRSKPQTRDTMGYFASVVPIRTCLRPQRSFVEILMENHEAQVEDFAHAMPFAELAKIMASTTPPNRHPIFDVRFALQNHPLPDIELPGISTRLRTISTGTSRFDIACELTEDGPALEAVWLYRPSLVHDEEIRHLDLLMSQVLAEVGRNPNLLPGQINPN